MLTPRAGKKEKGPFVYVYSVFHPFFEQFLTIVWDSVMLVTLSSVLVLLVTFVFTGSLHLSAILAINIASLLLDVMGAMHVSGIQLNAVSLVNMAMCAGIGLEFLSHTAHAFLTAHGTKCAFLHLVYMCSCTSMKQWSTEKCNMQGAAGQNRTSRQRGCCVLRHSFDQACWRDHAGILTHQNL